MQTFLPHRKFTESALALDPARLKNQTNECLSIMQALDKGTGWIHHPATKMWKGYEMAFCLYGITIAEENKRRGHAYGYSNDAPFRGYYERLIYEGLIPEPPWWLGRAIFHASHLDALRWKKPEHYGPSPHRLRLAYVWPVNETQAFRLSKPDQKRIAARECTDPFTVYDVEETE